MIWKLQDLMDSALRTQTQINGKWIPARPLRDSSWIARIRAAWAVVTDKADAVKWPEGQ